MSQNQLAPNDAATPPDMRYRLENSELVSFDPFAPATPPDVRRGSAPPSSF